MKNVFEAGNCLSIKQCKQGTKHRFNQILHYLSVIYIITSKNGAAFQTSKCSSIQTLDASEYLTPQRAA